MNFNAGIFIDDGGTPGAIPPSQYLHSKRKSWAAVLISNSVSEDMKEAVSLLLHYACDEFGVDELHFTDIYSGKGKYKGVSINERLELFAYMSRIFRIWDLPIFFQTLSPEFGKEINQFYRFEEKFKFLDLSNYEHLALLLLLIEIQNFKKQSPEDFTNPLPLFIDEGLVKSGNKLKLVTFSDVIVNGEINFIKSNDLPYMQLADFAAFSISRTQWLLSKKSLSPLDKTFLEIIGEAKLNAINLEFVHIVLNTHKQEDYEGILEQDRIFKGLSQFPKEKDV